MENDLTDLDLYALLDAVCHTAMDACPAPEIVEAARVLHKQVIEEQNFDLVKRFKHEDESLVLTKRKIDALYKINNPFETGEKDDKEKGN